MKKQLDLKVQARSLAGKKVKQLRAENLLVANLVIPGEKSVALQCSLKEFRPIYKQAGETQVVYLQVDGEKDSHPVLVDSIDYSPLSSEIKHVVFKEVNLKEKVEAPVPVELVGNFDLPGFTYLLVKDEIEVSALPTQIPEKFAIDLSLLKDAKQSITLADLKLPESVAWVLSEEEKAEEVSVLVIQEEKEEVIEEVPVVEAAPEATPAEGATAPAPEATKEEGKKSEKS